MIRPYQRGSLSLHNGQWTGRYFDHSLGSSLNERVHRRVFLGKNLTKRDARKKLEGIIDSLAPRLKQDLTFAEFTTKWEPVFRSQYKQSSWWTIQSILKSRLLPEFGSKKLSEITVEDVQTFTSKLNTSGNFARTTLTYFRTIWRTAKLWGYATHDPCEGIMLPRPAQSSRPYFNEKDTQIVINASQEPYKTLYWLLAQTGMRIGEALALTWTDIDLQKKQILIQKNVYRGQVQTPKTAAGFRTISISSLLAAHLQRRREQKISDLLFTNREGKIYNANTLLRNLHLTLGRLGIPRAGFHAFRHANATILDKIQAPMGLRQQRLGHTSAKTTLDIYTHSVDNGSVAESFDEVLKVDQ